MEDHTTNYQLIGPFRQVITLSEVALRGSLRDTQLDIISEGGILIDDKTIRAVGKFEELLKKTKSTKADVIQLTGDYVVMPGFVDAHTHICFGGSRANDYAMRNSGATYLEIAASGGGIWDTVRETRKASEQVLINGIHQRLDNLLRSGISTVEVKSGYGLLVEEELKMLRSIKAADSLAIQDLIPTCLAAHILPKDYDGDHSEYLREISERLFPVIKEENLSNRIDAFVEEGAFSEQLISPYFSNARALGFDITVHADQFSVGGTSVAVAHEAISADHLEASTAKEIELLAGSQVIATALPGASIGLGCPFTPARKLLDAGCGVAIASDWNPGSAPMGDLMVQASVLATYEKLSNAEVLAGITTRAAAALGLKDRGKLTAGSLADFNIYDTNHFNEVFYQQGMMKPAQVWKNGKQVYNAADVIQ
ncbi:MAG: imidazolonepropionase [Bacteroidota bacterium]